MRKRVYNLDNLSRKSKLLIQKVVFESLIIHWCWLHSLWSLGVHVIHECGLNKVANRAGSSLHKVLDGVSPHR